MPATCCRRRVPGSINKDGLVATGLLAIADFVPGDVDKNQMIADYVNDQIDVVGRAFLGLSVACARCHDHKFDPISTEDYYALAGIFFSTRLIPGPVAGNTPLVRVPLLSPAEMAQLQAQAAPTHAAGRNSNSRSPTRLTALPCVSHEPPHRAVGPLPRGRLRMPQASVSGQKPTPSEVAKQHGLHEGVLTEWIAFLDRIEKQPTDGLPARAPRSRGGQAVRRPQLEKAAAVAAGVARRAGEARRGRSRTLAGETRLGPRGAASLSSGRSAARHRCRRPGRAVAEPCWLLRRRRAAGFPKNAPIKTTAKIDDHTKPVLRFDGQSVLEAQRPVPRPAVCSSSTRPPPQPVSRRTHRRVGRCRHRPARAGPDDRPRRLDCTRSSARTGSRATWWTRVEPTGFETVCITWGPGGTTMRRNGVETAAPKKIDGISSDPKIAALKIGGPGSGGSPRFHGDVAEVRVYNRQLDRGRTQTGRSRTARGLVPTRRSEEAAARSARRVVRRIALAPRTVLAAAGGAHQASCPEVQKRLEATACRVGRYCGTSPRWTSRRRSRSRTAARRGRGTKASRMRQVFIRGDHKRLGKTVPRGFPKILTGEREERITEGSGRLQLADWLTRPENPLTARVMVNRIWQHHFGEGLVRTPNDFGERGERPTHPELLDYLAARFVESGWSVKAMHRLIMLSAAYQQSSSADAPPCWPATRTTGCSVG